MAIDMRDLPLGLGSRGEGEGFAAGGSKLALARRRVVDAWLDDDASGLAGAIDQGERDFGSDLDGLAGFRSAITPLTEEFRARRQLARGGAERNEARSGLAATLGRLSQSVAASDDPARRDLLGREARGLIESHRAGGLLDPEDAEALAGDYDKGLGQAQAARIAREDPALAQQLLRDESLFPGLDSEMRERYAKAAGARLAVRRELGDLDTDDLDARVTARARAGAELSRRIRAGEADAGDVAAAQQLGEIDPATARRLRTNIETAREAKRREAEGIARVEAAFSDGRKLDPDNADDRAALDAHYKLTRQGWNEASLTPDQVRGSLVDYIVESGAIPSDVLIKLPFYFDEGTADQKWEAADLIQLLIERDFDPQEIPIEYRRKALGIAELVKRGYEPSDAAHQYQQKSENVGGFNFVGQESSSPPLNEILANLGFDPAQLSGTNKHVKVPEGGALDGSSQPEKIQLAQAKQVIDAIRIFGPMIIKDIFAETERNKKAAEEEEKRKRNPPVDLTPPPPPPPPLVKPEPAEGGGGTSPASAGNSRDAIQMRPEDLIPAGPISPPDPEREQLIPEPVESGPATNLPVGIDPADLIELFPADPSFEAPSFVESRGGPKIEGENTDIARVIEAARDELGAEHEHVGGARDKDGNKVKETYFRNRQTGGHKGSNRGDIAFKHPKTGRMVIINTHDSLVGGEPTGREADSAARLLVNKDASAYLVMIPKLRDGETLDVEALKEFIKPLLEETAKPWDPNASALNQWVGGRFVKK